MADTEKSFKIASQQYAALGVDVDRALRTLASIPISLHCWQGDDITGFENATTLAGSGLATTGNYPGKARNAAELRSDLDKAFSLIPGKNRLNLHAFYAEHQPGKTADRDALEPKHFAGWIDWAKGNKIGMDFNPTFFAHPKAADSFTLTNRDSGIRKFWIDHGKACRKIGETFGQELGSVCVTNIWIPDGYKDTPIDRKSPRELLEKSLDEILAGKIDRRYNLDAVEGKLFGIGSESYTAGSHEFYLGYAIQNKILLCLDAGHFHPTETITDKISSVLMHLDEILLHVSRGVRWDSDHVVILNDDLKAIAEELVRGDFLNRVHIGLDYFDASINRVAAWVIGTRAMLKALLIALLEPTDKLRQFELAGDFTSRLAMLEECKSLPFGLIWDHYCQMQNVPPGAAWLNEIKNYELKVQSQRT
ncbi:MAG TPA: L-rhamnose isomerase [Tepidisphaeraceae bacterium]|nr:L-rhamnose isomerase [Tepidisphaeraceae bacterium]